MSNTAVAHMAAIAAVSLGGYTLAANPPPPNCILGSGGFMIRKQDPSRLEPNHGFECNNPPPHGCQQTIAAAADTYHGPVTARYLPLATGPSTNTQRAVPPSARPSCATLERLGRYRDKESRWCQSSGDPARLRSAACHSRRCSNDSSEEVSELRRRYVGSQCAHVSDQTDDVLSRAARKRCRDLRGFGRHQPREAIVQSQLGLEARCEAKGCDTGREGQAATPRMVPTSRHDAQCIPYTGPG
jgi:hypothetical protein